MLSLFQFLQAIAGSVSTTFLLAICLTGGDVPGSSGQAVKAAGDDLLGPAGERGASGGASGESIW